MLFKPHLDLVLKNSVAHVKYKQYLSLKIKLCQQKNPPVKNRRSPILKNL